MRHAVESFDGLPDAVPSDSFIAIGKVDYPNVAHDVLKIYAAEIP
jgi:hypothetical protein